MKSARFNEFCQALPATHMVRQWGNSYVWKVGDKVFAILSNWAEHTAGQEPQHVGIKCSELAFEMLCQEQGIRPSPYLGRYKWVQISSDSALSDDDIEAYIEASYTMVKAKLTRAKRKELGID